MTEILQHLIQCVFGVLLGSENIISGNSTFLQLAYYCPLLLYFGVEVGELKFSGLDIRLELFLLQFKMDIFPDFN